MEKIKINLPIIVEGRYDKSALMGYLDAKIITTGGFSIFNDKEKQALLRRISQNGVILLTDSDGGGKQIRSYLLSALPKEKVINLYIPQIEGKEKRKKTASKSGLLGVEGIDADTLRRLFLPFSSENTTIWGCRFLQQPRCLSFLFCFYLDRFFPVRFRALHIHQQVCQKPQRAQKHIKNFP